MNDFINIFDPHQGDLRRRIINSNRYSGVEQVDVNIYLRGLGEWIDGEPYIIPKDAKFTRDVTKFSLDRFVKDLSVLSVINSIQSITLFLDVTFTNPSDGPVQTSFDWSDSKTDLLQINIGLQVNPRLQSTN